MADRLSAAAASVRNAAEIFRSLPGGYASGALVVALGAVATVFEGVGILLILPFLDKLINGPQARLSVALPQLPVIDRWLVGVPVAHQLSVIAALILGAVLFRECVAYANGFLKQHLAMRVANMYRAELHEAMIRAEARVSLRYPHGYAQNLLHLEANRITALVLQVLSLAELLIITVTVLAIMLSISSALTALVLFVLVAGGLPLTRFFRWIKRSSLGRMESRATLNDYLAQLMPFLASVHVFGGHARERAVFAARFGEMFERDLRLYRTAGLIGPIYRAIGVVGVLGVAMAAVALATDTRTVAWVIPFILLFSRLLPVMNGLNHAFGTMSDGLEGFRKFVDEIEFLRAHRLADGTRSFPASFRTVELRDVWFSYDGERPVLRDVSLTIRRGKHIALVGPSGSGKSTLCLLLCRLHDPAKGEVLVDGVSLSEMKLSEVRRAVSLVEQAPVLLNDTFQANVTYGMPDASDADVRRAVWEANADEFIEASPDGYASRVGNLGGSLSGGERQRVALARALLRRPQLLILDEATSAVDARSETLIKQAIERLRGQTTVVSVAHRLSTIKDADEIHFVRDGRIVASGTFAELGVTSEEFREYVSTQQLGTEDRASE